MQLETTFFSGSLAKKIINILFQDLFGRFFQFRQLEPLGLLGDPNSAKDDTLIHQVMLLPNRNSRQYSHQFHFKPFSPAQNGCARPLPPVLAASQWWQSANPAKWWPWVFREPWVSCLPTVDHHFSHGKKLHRIDLLKHTQQSVSSDGYGFPSGCEHFDEDWPESNRPFFRMLGHKPGASDDLHSHERWHDLRTWTWPMSKP